MVDTVTLKLVLPITGLPPGLGLGLELGLGLSSLALTKIALMQDGPFINSCASLSLLTPPSLHSPHLPGYTTVEVIQNCSCVQQSCYRGDYFQSVSVLVNDKRQEEVKINMSSINSNTNHYIIPTSQLVNTGRCIGKCSGISINSRCVQ